MAQKMIHQEVRNREGSLTIHKNGYADKSLNIEYLGSTRKSQSFYFFAEI